MEHTKLSEAEQLKSSKAKVGISACLLGQKVRYDGGHKGSDFCQHALHEFVDYLPLCPEVGIGMTVPRPTIRLERGGQDEVRAVVPKTGQDVTDELSAFADRYRDKIAQLSGYILCAKSPSCGMERVRVYEPGEKHNVKEGMGIFAQRLQQLEPALPMEEDGRLNDPLLRENFVARLFVYAEWKALNKPVSKKDLYQFHTRHKLLLLAHDQPLYRELGRLLGDLSELTSAFADDYILKVMNALKGPASKRDHTNVLQHVQGYFKNDLSAIERQELADIILQYRQGLEPLSAPLTLIKHYLRLFPKPYLLGQSYFQPYPNELRLRYGL
ncbi:YbgA family protein [Aliidiomarina celeris]|uniref:YbgA family protein n=1 Tax=Aliidiomarina celeris TaxID=2249428 RepID=UPI000DEA39A6|nr:DUF523 and DUF1722 domain-containing protein [Aliidiomarina celeris]